MQIIDNIPVWGDPIDQGALAQIQNCAREAVAVAMIGDHHLGYAVPIGGVVAYVDAISPSGVGFDIACFSGSTRIFTLDGKHPALSDVEGQSVFILSCLPNGKVVPVAATVKKTRKRSALVRVTLDNEETVDCTPDHPFMLRDGSYKEAASLDVGQSLMPLYWTHDKDGYVLVRQNNTRRLDRLHWMVFRAGLTGAAPKVGKANRLIIHHENFVRADNHPRNLIPMGKVEHDALHAELRDRSHMGTPAYESHRINGIKAFWVKARHDKEFMEKRGKQGRANGRGGASKASASARRGGNGVRGAKRLLQYNAQVDRSKPKEYGPTICPMCGVKVGCPQWLGRHVRKEHPEIL